MLSLDKCSLVIFTLLLAIVVFAFCSETNPNPNPDHLSLRQQQAIDASNDDNKLSSSSRRRRPNIVYDREASFRNWLPPGDNPSDSTYKPEVEDVEKKQLKSSPKKGRLIYETKEDEINADDTNDEKLTAWFSALQKFMKIDPNIKEENDLTKQFEAAADSEQNEKKVRPKTVGKNSGSSSKESKGKNKKTN